MPVAAASSNERPEIPTREWPIFLDRLGREHRAWLVPWIAAASSRRVISRRSISAAEHRHPHRQQGHPC
jgi:hypothetical protein